MLPQVERFRESVEHRLEDIFLVIERGHIRRDKEQVDLFPLELLVLSPYCGNDMLNTF